MGLFDILKKKKDTKLDQYLDGYNKSTQTIATGLGRIFNGFRGVSDEFLEDLTQVLLEADVGIDTTVKIVDGIREDNKRERINDVEKLQQVLVDQIDALYKPDEVAPIAFNENGPTVILMVGVNGVGKTTSIAKLASFYSGQGKKVAMVAADTFRAGAKEQLEAWGKELDIPCISGKDKSDPASVIVDGCKYALANDIDILFCDTAGRLQNKNNLMAQLDKMYRVIGKNIPGQPAESWLVIDSTTGQNGLIQAQAFQDTARVTGIVLTKFDGTGRGGIVLAIKDKWNVPVRFIGTGETEFDLLPFQLDVFVQSIIDHIGDEDE